MTVDFIYNIGRDSVDTSGFSAYVPLLSERMSYMMKKAPFFMAALAALTLTGAFLASPSAGTTGTSSEEAIKTLGSQIL